MKHKKTISFLKDLSHFKSPSHDHEDGGTRDYVMKGDLYAFMIKMIIVTIAGIIYYMTMQIPAPIQLNFILLCTTALLSGVAILLDGKHIIYYLAYFLSKKVYQIDENGVRVGTETPSKKQPEERHFYAEKAVSHLFVDPANILF